MLLEKRTEFSRGNFWVDAGGDPEEMERVVRSLIGAVRAAADAGVFRAGAVFV